MIFYKPKVSVNAQVIISPISSCNNTLLVSGHNSIEATKYLWFAQKYVPFARRSWILHNTTYAWKQQNHHTCSDIKSYTQ